MRAARSSSRWCETGQTHEAASPRPDRVQAGRPTQKIYRAGNSCKPPAARRLPAAKWGQCAHNRRPVPPAFREPTRCRTSLLARIAAGCRPDSADYSFVGPTLAKSRSARGAMRRIPNSSTSHPALLNTMIDLPTRFIPHGRARDRQTVDAGSRTPACSRRRLTGAESVAGEPKPRTSSQIASTISFTPMGRFKTTWGERPSVTVRSAHRR